MTAPPYQTGGDAAGALNQPVPANAVLLTPAGPNGPPGTLTAAESVAVYTAQPGDPEWDIRLAGGGHVCYYRAPAAIRVGVPVEWDAPLVVYDPAAAPTGELRCWRAVIDPARRVIACQGWGLFDPSPCGSGLPLHGWGTGSGLSSDAGLLRGHELEAACERRERIRHAIRVHGPVSGGHVPPARKSDQSAAVGAPMGTRWKLVATDRQIMARTPPTGNVRLGRFLHAVCFAARTYGLVALDGADEWIVPLEHRCSHPYVATLADSSPTGFLSWALRPTTGDPNVGFPFAQLVQVSPGTF